MNGFVCLGDPEHKGVLPFRQGRHRRVVPCAAGRGRYNASVDSLSNPEIFATWPHAVVSKLGIGHTVTWGGLPRLRHHLLLMERAFS